MGNHFGENFSALSKVQEFPRTFSTNCLNTSAQFEKCAQYHYTTVLIVILAKQ